MEVIVAKTAGFCFGVTRAVNTVYEQLNQTDGKIYTYGPIIHNMEVVKDLESKGVIVLNSTDEINASDENRTIIIRSHGISRDEETHLINLGFKIVDATCPFVKKIHTIVERYSGEGYHILIIGDPKHPEVCGIKGWVKTDAVNVIQSIEDIDALKLSLNTPVCVVAQTTFNFNKFQEFVEIIAKKGYYIHVLNTICNATEDRQKEARVLAAKVDAMIVIGDKHSSNTQKLFEISKKECENTYYIQTSNEMDYGSIRSVSNVGITAGASTPNNIIEEVSKNVRKL